MGCYRHLNLALGSKKIADPWSRYCIAGPVSSGQRRAITNLHLVNRKWLNPFVLFLFFLNVFRKQVRIIEVKKSIRSRSVYCDCHIKGKVKVESKPKLLALGKSVSFPFLGLSLRPASKNNRCFRRAGLLRTPSCTKSLFYLTNTSIMKSDSVSFCLRMFFFDFFMKKCMFSKLPK